MTTEEGEALLGRILDGTDDLAEATVTLWDFDEDSHKLIWQRMMEVWRRGLIPDRTNVGRELLSHDEMNAVPFSYLIQLGDFESWARGKPWGRHSV